LVTIGGEYGFGDSAICRGSVTVGVEHGSGILVQNPLRSHYRTSQQQPPASKLHLTVGGETALSHAEQ